MPFKIEFFSEYKSIKKLQVINQSLDNQLPDFTVITGLNGTGKTHLLEAIREGHIELDFIKEYIKDIYKAVLDNSNYKRITKNLNFIQFNYKNTTLTKNDVIEEKISEKIAIFIKNRFDITKDCIDFFKKNTTKNVTYDNIPEDIAKTLERDLLNCCVNRHFNDIFSPLKELLKDNINLFLEGDVKTLENSPQFKKFHDTQIFSPDIYKIFYNYAALLQANYLKAMNNPEVNQIDRKDVQKKFHDGNGIPPWEMLNKIFQEQQFSFSVSKPDIEDIGLNFSIQLIKNGTQQHLQMSDLSSGEKVIISVLSSLFSVQDTLTKNYFPKILLLDEPDAHLHPQMCKMLIKFLKEQLVEKLGIKVIMTTHSPTTVALAPEESIFEMDAKEGILSKITQKEAIRLLTAGIPNLLIDPNNRHYIFCESDDEAELWRGIYNELKSNNNIWKSIVDKNHEKELIFIGTGLTFKQSKEGMTTKENWGAGEAAVKKTLEATKDNQQIFGLIDWDTKSNPDKELGIIISCQKTRYSIENILYDPVFLLIAYTNLPKNKKQLDFMKDLNCLVDIERINNILLQEKVDKLINHILEENEASEKIKIRYNDNMCIEIRKDYLYNDGHELEKEILTKIPAFKELLRGNKLTEYIVNNVLEASCKIKLIPDDLKETFKLIIEAKK